MSESLILEKLDSLSSEIISLKQELQELKADKPATKRLAEQKQPENLSVLEQFSDKCSGPELANLIEELLASTRDITEMLARAKAANDLISNVEPVAQQAYPATVKFFDELDDQFNVDELIGLVRGVLTNLNSINEGVDMLRMGVELRDEIIPVVQIAYPKVLKFLNNLHEGEFQSEHIATLLHTLLLNIHTLSDLLNMAKPVTELVKDIHVVLRETDVLHSINSWLDGLQQSNSVFKVAGTAVASARKLSISENQAEEISKAIEKLDFSQVQPVSVLSALKYLRDPEIQKALGAIVMVLQTTGACLQAFQKETGNEK